MKNKKILFIGLVATTIASLSSCSSDYLETSPTESISTGQAVGTTTNAYKALNGIAKTYLFMKTIPVRIIFTTIMRLVGVQ